MAGLTAALIGPGRIGRHHAKWLAACGCELVGFACSSAEHLEPRAAELAETCGQTVPGFADVEAMLTTARPALVSVCSPAEEHLEHVAAALRAGCAVLCEKPLCWDSELDAAIDQAERLAALATQVGRPLGVNLQYTLAGDDYRALVGSRAAPRRVDVILESRGRGAERTPSEVWMELGPHALSLAQALAPGAAFEDGAWRAAGAPRTVVATGRLRRDGAAIAVRLETGQVMDGALRRRFGADEEMVDYSGRNNASGVYRTVLSGAAGERESEDWLQGSLRGFVAAVTSGVRPPIEASAALGNLRAQVTVAKLLSAEGE